jgi:thiamine-phosphate pyrophosphorylase
MQIQFTPAAERALSVAAGWTNSSCLDDGRLRVPEVLLGLLAEPECRAALLLARSGIDAAAVHERFPQLVPAESPDSPRANGFSIEWIQCLDAATRLLVDYPRPLVLATEHLLLGIVAVPGEVSAWLAKRGLNASDLEVEIHRLSGHQPGPLPFDSEHDDCQSDGGDFKEIAPDPPAGGMPPHEQVAALRVLDAAANRAEEGLRVVEDYLRFVLDDRHLTEVSKNIRHELAAALQVFPAAQRHAARDTRSDVGTTVSLPGEQSRADLAAVAQASFKRLEQSLRSLEEFSKTFDPETATQLEQLRYRAYTLQRAAGITTDAVRRLADARLYVLVDGRESSRNFQQLVESLVAAGVGAIQLRDKRLCDRELVERARQLRRATAGTPTLFIMNDRPDLAVLAGSDGVHVGQDELTLKDARRIIGPRGLVGVSTHSLAQARAAVLDGASYIGVGPTFPSATKEFAGFTGTQLLRSVQAEIRLPAFAIGGITLENLSDVLGTGFGRIAVSSAITGASDPAAAARQFLAALRSASG